MDTHAIPVLTASLSCLLFTMMAIPVIEQMRHQNNAGTLPAEWSAMRQLKDLHLENNNITGTIPLVSRQILMHPVMLIIERSGSVLHYISWNLVDCTCVKPITYHVHSLLTARVPAACDSVSQAWTALSNLTGLWLSDNDGLSCPASGGIAKSLPYVLAEALRQGNFEDPCLAPSNPSNHVWILIAAFLGGMLVLLIILIIVLSVWMLYHRSTCSDPR